MRDEESIMAEGAEGAEEIRAVFQEKSRRRITAAIRTLRQTLQEEHEEHVGDLLRGAPSDASAAS